VVATFLFGLNVGAQWIVLIAVLPAALYLDFSKIQRIIIVGSLLLLINLKLVLPSIYTPPLNMDDNFFLLFLFSNISAIGVICTVTVNGFINMYLASLQKKELAEIKHMSNIDPLTKLSNRRYAERFFEMVNKDKRNAPLMLCLFDVDDFKNVNDTYGHEVGDTVLVSIAELLRQNTRDTDLVCRWGGEEFLIGLTKCELEDGRRIFTKISQAIKEKTITTHKGEINITITGGAAIVENDDIKATINECDRKLYEGKGAGKNKVIV